MDKKSKETIKEVIEDILQLRKKKLNVDKIDDSSFFYPNKKSQIEKQERVDYRQNRTIEEYDIPLVKLNNLLKGADRVKEVIDIEMQMKKIQVKKFITTKEFEEIYNISQSSQKDYRGRLNDPLPYHQKVRRGTIVYVVEEVEKWFDNQYK